MKIEASSETLGSGSLPPYDGDTAARAQHVGYERDDFGTVVTEVTTTRKRYRVQDV